MVPPELGIEGALIYCDFGYMNATLYDDRSYRKEPEYLAVPAGVSLVKCTFSIRNLANVNWNRAYINAVPALQAGCGYWASDGITNQIATVTTAPMAVAEGDYFGPVVLHFNQSSQATWFSIEKVDPATRYAIVYVNGDGAPPLAGSYMTWSLAAVDASAFFNLAQPTRLTVPEGVSLVQLRGNVRFTAADDGSDFHIHALEVSKNRAIEPTPDLYGLSAAWVQLSASGNGMHIASAPMEVVAGDFFELIALMTGSDLIVEGSAGHTWFSIEEVPPCKRVLAYNTTPQSFASFETAQCALHATVYDTDGILVDGGMLQVPEGVTRGKFMFSVTFDAVAPQTANGEAFFWIESFEGHVAGLPQAANRGNVSGAMILWAEGSWVDVVPGSRYVLKGYTTGTATRSAGIGDWVAAMFR